MRLKWIIIVVVLLILLGGGAAGYVFFHDRIMATVDHMLGREVAGAAPEPVGLPAVPIPGNYYKLPRIMGTVIATDYTPHMLQAEISVYLHDPSDLIWVQAYLPRITDAFQSYIRDEMVFDRQHPVDIDALRRVMLPRINGLIAPARIDDISVLSLTVE
jgi:flagellar basal body-associated protein FliL